MKVTISRLYVSFDSKDIVKKKIAMRINKYAKRRIRFTNIICSTINSCECSNFRIHNLNTLLCASQKEVVDTIFIDLLNNLEDCDVNFTMTLAYDTVIDNKVEESQSMTCKLTQTDTFDEYLKNTISYFVNDAALVIEDTDNAVITLSVTVA